MRNEKRNRARAIERERVVSETHTKNTTQVVEGRDELLDAGGGVVGVMGYS
jgi:hypothetical protein